MCSIDKTRNVAKLLAPWNSRHTWSSAAKDSRAITVTASDGADASVGLLIVTEKESEKGQP